MLDCSAKAAPVAFVNPNIAMENSSNYNWALGRLVSLPVSFAINPGIKHGCEVSIIHSRYSCFPAQLVNAGIRAVRLWIFVVLNFSTTFQHFNSSSKQVLRIFLGGVVLWPLFLGPESTFLRLRQRFNGSSWRTISLLAHYWQALFDRPGCWKIGCWFGGGYSPTYA